MKYLQKRMKRDPNCLRSFCLNRNHTNAEVLKVNLKISICYSIQQCNQNQTKTKQSNKKKRKKKKIQYGKVYKKEKHTKKHVETYNDKKYTHAKQRQLNTEIEEKHTSQQTIEIKQTLITRKQRRGNKSPVMGDNFLYLRS